MNHILKIKLSICCRAGVVTSFVGDIPNNLKSIIVENQ